MREMSFLENGQKTNWPKHVIVYTDGACRGNPGPSSIGVVFYTSDEEFLYEQAQAIGVQTNNFAEYEAVRTALQIAKDNKIKKLVLRSDSQLLVRQLSGEYKVKSETLKPLFMECKELSKQFQSVSYEHVMREYNERADEIANLALDASEI